MSTVCFPYRCLVLRLVTRCSISTSNAGPVATVLVFKDDPTISEGSVREGQPCQLHVADRPMSTLRAVLLGILIHRGRVVAAVTLRTAFRASVVPGLLLHSDVSQTLSLARARTCTHSLLIYQPFGDRVTLLSVWGSTISEVASCPYRQVQIAFGGRNGASPISEGSVMVRIPGKSAVKVKPARSAQAHVLRVQPPTPRRHPPTPKHVPTPKHPVPSTSPLPSSPHRLSHQKQKMTQDRLHCHRQFYFRQQVSHEAVRNILFP